MQQMKTLEYQRHVCHLVIQEVKEKVKVMAYKVLLQQLVCDHKIWSQGQVSLIHSWCYQFRALTLFSGPKQTWPNLPVSWTTSPAGLSVTKSLSGCRSNNPRLPKSINWGHSFNCTFLNSQCPVPYHTTQTATPNSKIHATSVLL